MELEKDVVALQYQNKLKELYSLITNPVGLSPPSESTLDTIEAQEFLLENDIRNKHSVSLHSIKGLEAAGSVYHLIQSYSKQQLEAEENPLKRRNLAVDHGVAHKARKVTAVDFPSRLMPDIKTSSRMVSKSGNLEAQIKTLEKKANEFLNKDVADLEIISLPENFPTEVHSVLSLAEFYYLTQTLPLIKLLPGSHKTLLTENFESALLEGKIAVLHSRIEELKRQKKWSLRQPVRYYDPFLYARKNKTIRNHTWDNVLQEGSWMATDFKESSKFKKSCCFLMAQAVQDFWTFGKEVCIKPKPVVHLDESQKGAFNNALSAAETDVKIEDTEMVGVAPTADSTTEPVVSSADPADIVPEPETIDVSKLLAPVSADSMQEDNSINISSDDFKQYGLPRENRGPFKAHINLEDLKKIDQSIIKTLPKYTPFKDIATSPKVLTSGETSIIPVSRMLHPMEDDKGWYKIILKDHEPLDNTRGPGLPEYQKGLFGVQSHRRVNYLRPPKPPLIKNIEYRSPTIWLPQDDKYLIHFVAEYCFNWDLIAENLSVNSATLKRYESNIERRTPWQCFERYIQLNEKFQFSDMKGHNSYSAQQWLEHAHKAQSTTKRRISPLGVGNDSIQRGHRRLRWASMFDAMRKSMRKRETAAAKANSRRGTSQSEIPSQGTNSSNSSFSSNGTVKRPSDRIPTPSELSKLKHDRDKSIQEAYLNQQASKVRMAAAVNQPKGAGSPVSGVSPSMGSAKDISGAMNANNAPGRRMSQIPARQGVSAPGVSASRPANMSGQRASGNQASQSLSAQSQQQQQAKQLLGNLKRPTSPNGTPYTVEQIQRLLQLQKQRRLIQQQNQAGKDSPMAANVSQESSSGQKFPGQASSQSVSSNFGSNVAGSALVGQQGSSSGMMQGKRAAVPSKNRIQFAPAQVSAIINSIQQKNPNLTKDQVTKLAASYLANLQQQQNKLDQSQQMGRSSSAGDGTARAQQNFQTRQAQLTRQRLSSQSSPAPQGKELDGQTLSRLQYEERKKLMMQQGGSQYGKPGAAQQNYSLAANSGSQQTSNQSNSSDGEKHT